LGIQDKINAVRDISNPIFSDRERAALELATMFTENYHAFTDENVAAWKAHFTDEEFVELGAFMAHAHGYGQLVEMLGLGDADQVSATEI
jgi:alkylhydroperoxidase family enzyme